MTNANNSKTISAKAVHEGETAYLTSCNAWGNTLGLAQLVTAQSD